MEKATVVDNRINRVAAVLSTSHPFVVVKPKGFLNPIHGHYTTRAGALAAARRWNANNGR
ncbi:hypothetical protein EVB91_175 [Rhizobium phage RHph_I1_18]|nr:hypothetical protein EVB91_175 [Rhizobium phage RHph_I1_18]